MTEETQRVAGICRHSRRTIHDQCLDCGKLPREIDHEHPGNIYGEEGRLIGRKDMSDGDFLAPLLDEDHHPFIGICQSCGAYWDVRHQPICPPPCGGEVL